MQTELPFNSESLVNNTFLNKAVSNLRDKVEFKDEPQGFYPPGTEDPTPNEAFQLEEVENMMMDELLKCGFNYEDLGESNFQKLISLGLQSLEEQYSPEGMECEEEDEQEDEEEDEMEEEQGAEEVLFDIFQDIYEEVKANPESEDEYLETRLYNAIKTKGIEINFREED